MTGSNTAYGNTSVGSRTAANNNAAVNPALLEAAMQSADSVVLINQFTGPAATAVGQSYQRFGYGTINKFFPVEQIEFVPPVEESFIEPQSFMRVDDGTVAGSITADSQPDYDRWGPDDYWTCSDFMQWHRLNVAAYGTNVANQKIEQAFSILGTFEHAQNCKFDRDFVTYFESYGFTVGNVFSNIWLSLGNVGNVIGDTTDAAANTAKMLKWLVPVLVIIAAIIAIKFAFKKFA